jgi:hypothetical protein
MARLNTALTSIIEEVFETLVGEAGYHCRSVTEKVTFDKGKPACAGEA